jgi:putative ABC transport system permease protein
MRMLLLIAWRNIWRNRTRSLVVISSIAVGVCAIALAVGFVNSMADSFIRDSINHDYAHLQLHHPQFVQEPEARFSLSQGAGIGNSLQKNPAVKSYSERLLINGMIASSRANAGVQIYGINLEQEAAVTSLDSLLTAGTYFTVKPRNAVLISRKLADRLKAELRTKLVLTFQDMDGEVVAGAFRVEGIFESPSPRLNEGAVYVRRQDLSPLLGADSLLHEVAVLLHKNEDVTATAQQLRHDWPQAEVKSWEELSPELKLMQQQSSVMMAFMLVI